MEKKNIYDKIPKELKEELFTDLLMAENIKHLKIERIVSEGQKTDANDWYDQKEDEWVILLEGEAGIRKADHSVIHLRKGNFLHIPAHQKHQVAYTSTSPKAVWLAIFMGV